MGTTRRTVAVLLFALSALTATLPHTHHSIASLVQSEPQLAAAQHEVCVACTRDQQQIAQANVATVREAVAHDVTPPRFVEVPRSAELTLALLRAPPVTL